MASSLAVLWYGAPAVDREPRGCPATGWAPAELARRCEAIAMTPNDEQRALDLSVVVVFHDMRREAARTLRSLTRSYQRQMDAVAYEVIVVDNGSAPDQRLEAAFVTAFGPEFRLLDVGEGATPSPVPAVNLGIAAAQGEALAVMIDGAHVLTPGVLHFGLLGLRTYAPAVVATQQWYVGPGQQPVTVAEGYDATLEDELFAGISWPDDGYRLFEIGHFVGDRDWFDGILESNCLFVPRELVDRTGSYDARFTEPGGGFCNLDFFERVASPPEVTVTTIIGEGSFHQVHGGTTTNAAEPDERRRQLASYADRYAQIRGRPFVGPEKSIHYVGGMRSGAMRTKPRRRSGRAFFRRGATRSPGGFPQRPEPVPAELAEDFLDAYWRSLAWQAVTWFGHPTAMPAGDLVALQELLVTSRPDWVIEIGAAETRGRTLFLASVLDALGTGRIVALGDRGPDSSDHPRVHHAPGDPLGGDIARHVVETVEPDARSLLILGGRRDRARTIREFERYAELVGVGSFVVVTDTIVGGHPVWPHFGAGPAEAVEAILARHPDFVTDPTVERHGLSFSPGGYLRRARRG